jgi:carbon storage regulator
MLVLRRKAGEAIVLNGVITIYVLAVEGERVKLGISAPPEVVIVRSELLENQGQPGGPGSIMPPQAGPSPLPREVPRTYGEREHTGDAQGHGGESFPRSREPGQQAEQGRYGPRRRAPGDPGSASPTGSASPIGSGPLRYP